MQALESRPVAFYSPIAEPEQEQAPQNLHPDVELTKKDLLRLYPLHGLSFLGVPNRSTTPPLFNLYMNPYMQKVVDSWEDREVEDLGIGKQYILHDHKLDRAWRVTIWNNDGHSVEFIKPGSIESDVVELNMPFLAHASHTADKYYKEQRQEHYRMHPGIKKRAESKAIFDNTLR